MLRARTRQQIPGTAPQSLTHLLGACRSGAGIQFADRPRPLARLRKPSAAAVGHELAAKILVDFYDKQVL
jgi:hypothetical protein